MDAKGCGCFRLDVINLIGKDQKFPDGKKQEGELYGDMIPFTHNMPQAHIYIKELNEKSIFQISDDYSR